MLKLNDELLQKLADAKSIVFFTGAGISAESGISTFRGTDGIWNKLKPEELANFNAFLKNPDRVWEWYQYRRKIIHETGPNAAHLAIASMQDYFDEVTVITQNVDNLHTRAGSRKVFELHGNIERNYCIDCRTQYNEVNFKEADKVPRCSCGGLIRPDIVWFGEYLPQDEFTASEEAAERCDICFIVGTSAVVYPAAQIPSLAKRAGAYLAEINIEPTEISHAVNYSMMGKAGEVLPEILEAVKKLKNSG